MDERQTVTARVTVNAISNEPPSLTFSKLLTGRAGTAKLHSQRVDVPDSRLAGRLQAVTKRGDEIDVTLATEWRSDGYRTYLVDFSVPQPGSVDASIPPAADRGDRAHGARRFRVAIDGPSASGKSAAGSRVAARLGYPFVDTGSMYRAITWLALQQGVDPADADRLAALAESAELRIGPGPADGREMCSIRVNGQDVTPFLRDAAVERTVSQVSAVPAVRAALVRLQREAAPENVVMAGRDIGTVVLPDAELKVYLDASVDVRAVRRREELEQKGRSETLAQVEADLLRRDEIDSNRAASPLVPADDAEIIRNEGLPLEELVTRILRLARERGAVEAEPAR